MKKLILLVMLALSITSCTDRTEFGKCIGLFDEEDDNLKYHVSGWNLAMGIVFFEMIVPPIVVIADEGKCPIARK